MSTLLFFPNTLSDDFDPIFRCLGLAKTWQAHGGEAVFAVSSAYTERVQSAGFETYPLHTPRYTARHYSGAAYIHLSSMAYKIAQDGFDHPRIVAQTMQEARRIVQQVHPAALVGDDYALTWLIGRENGLPVVQMTNSITHPQPAPLIWWETTPREVTPPDLSPIFNPILKALDLPPLTSVNALMDGNLLLLPSILPLDPMPALPERTFYVGPIVSSISSYDAPPAALQSLEEEHTPVVYINLKRSASLIGNFIRLITAALGWRPYRVVVSTNGQEISPAECIAPNIHVFPHVPHAWILPRANAVIFQGSYMRMEVLQHGLPSIVIPFDTGEEYYGRLIQRTGAGINLRYSSGPYERLNVRWRGGLPWKQKTYSLHVRTEPTLTAETLHEAVNMLLEHASFKSSACALQQALQAMDGCTQAYHAIKRLLASAPVRSLVM